MILELSSNQKEWVETTINSMSMEQLIGMLLCSEDRKYSTQDWVDILDKVPLGNIFFGRLNVDGIRQTINTLQKKSKIPLTVAVDMEQGCNLSDFGTCFCNEMAIGATANEENAFELGHILAKEMRSMGIHWTFSPVADINLNFQNPVTNIRSFGDNADKVAKMVSAAIRGRQKDFLVAATAKHFPGDGVDDRDQHTCTSVNYLPMAQWRELYGKVWKSAIEDAKVMSIMSGHISLPDYQGFNINPEEAMPATLSSKLQVDLLRKELGFEGVIISDAATMIGITSRAKSQDLVVENIINGSDVYLFANPVKDFNLLMDAVKSGRLSEERVYESARRVLEMKARLNLHINPFGKELSETALKEHAKIAQKVTDQAIKIEKDNGIIPVKLKKGKILTVTITYREHTRVPDDLLVIDDELKARGFEVDHLKCPSHTQLCEIAKEYDMIFVNFLVTMHMKIGTIRLTNESIMSLWRAFYSDYDNVVFTSFGNPYVLYEQPHLPNLMLTYDPSDFAQRSAVKAWFGEIECNGISPVKQPKIEIKRFDF